MKGKAVAKVARRLTLTFLLGAGASALGACEAQKASAPPPATSTAVTAGGANAAAPAAVPRSTASAGLAEPQTQAQGRAQVGQPAPDFELSDLDGKRVRLSTLRGRPVVLEWFNPGCPFVNAAHTKGSLKDAAKRHVAEGVAWLAVNSGAPGRQGAGKEASVAGAKKFGLAHPVMLDESGEVGHAYGATNTPHMFVIDASGVLVYAGAIDNSPDGEAESPTGGALVRYVDDALADLAAKRPVRVPTSRAYGCSVKYATP
jgi:peroxiredoxin